MRKYIGYIIFRERRGKGVWFVILAETVLCVVFMILGHCIWDLPAAVTTVGVSSLVAWRGQQKAEKKAQEAEMQENREK